VIGPKCRGSKDLGTGIYSGVDGLGAVPYGTDRTSQSGNDLSVVTLGTEHQWEFIW
jgi:hypothetical protein